MRKKYFSEYLKWGAVTIVVFGILAIFFGPFTFFIGFLYLMGGLGFWLWIYSSKRIKFEEIKKVINDEIRIIIKKS